MKGTMCFQKGLIISEGTEKRSRSEVRGRKGMINLMIVSLNSRKGCPIIEGYSIMRR